MEPRRNKLVALFAILSAATLAVATTLPSTNRLAIHERPNLVYSDLLDLVKMTLGMGADTTCGKIRNFHNSKAAAAALIDTNKFDILSAHFEGNLGVQLGTIIFNGADCHYVEKAGMSTALVLSSGNVQFANIVAHLKVQVGFGQKVGERGSSEIDHLLGLTNSRVTRDCGILSIKVQAKVTTKLSFDYVFASEEYPTTKLTQIYSDAFTVLASVNGGEYVNVAHTPSGEPIMVANINNEKNAELFVANSDGSLPILYSGVSVKLTTSAIQLSVDDTVSLKIAVCDVGDYSLDSVAFLKLAGN